MREGHYVVIRVVPDLARNEALNVGIILWDPTGFRLGFDGEAISRVIRENPQLEPIGWLSAVLLNPVFGGQGLQLPELSPDLLVGLVISFVLLFLVNSEELVWRGSLLPRLQARWSALGASLFIGVFEGIFHLPLFFQPGSDQAAAGLPVFVIGSIAGAIVFSWLFNNTRGSLLLVQLFHIFANSWITLFAAAPADNVASQWLFNGLLVVMAAWLRPAYC
jgi:membrane protease YdiL (CAAX protease family)